MSTERNLSLELEVTDPFAKRGLARSPIKEGASGVTAAAIGSTEESPAVVGSSPACTPDEPLPGIRVVAEQLDEIIEFVSGRQNTNKELKQSLLVLRRAVRVARQEQVAYIRRVAEAERIAKGTQTKALSSPSGVTAANEATALTASEGKKTPSKKRPKRATIKAKRRLDGAPEPEGRMPKKAKGTRQAQVAEPQAGPSQPSVPAEGDANPWQLVSRGRKSNTPRPMKKVRDRGEALLVKTDKDKYADVLKSLRAADSLSALGQDVRSVRRTKNGEMILVLKRGAQSSGAAYKKLAQEVLGDGAQVRSLGAEVTLQCKQLDEVTTAEDVVSAVKEQCGTEVERSSVRLRGGFFGTQVAYLRLPVADAKKVIEKKKLKIGWSVCPVSVLQPPSVDRCYRCLESGHKSYDCKGPDRSKMCRRCGEEGHKAQECDKAPRCLICASKKQARNHAMGGPACPFGEANRKKPCK